MEDNVIIVFCFKISYNNHFIMKLGRKLFFIWNSVWSSYLKDSTLYDY